MLLFQNFQFFHQKELGNLQKNLYPVKSGLKLGETVVVSNTALLSNGMPVKVSQGSSTSKSN